MQEDSDEEFASAEALVRGTVARLRAQGGPAMAVLKNEGRGFCYYRADPDDSTHTPGRGCAVGVWLPDDPRSMRLGGTLAVPDTWSVIVELEPRLRPHRRLMRQLQRLHDGWDHDSDSTWDEYLDRWSDERWRSAQIDRQETADPEVP